MGKFGGDYRLGREKGVLENKSGNISETRKDGGKVTMGTHQRSFDGLPFLEIGICNLATTSYLRNT